MWQISSGSWLRTAAFEGERMPAARPYAHAISYEVHCTTFSASLLLRRAASLWTSLGCQGSGGATGWKEEGGVYFWCMLGLPSTTRKKVWTEPLPSVFSNLTTFPPSSYHMGLHLEFWRAGCTLLFSEGHTRLGIGGANYRYVPGDVWIHQASCYHILLCFCIMHRRRTMHIVRIYAVRERKWKHHVDLSVYFKPNSTLVPR